MSCSSRWIRRIMAGLFGKGGRPEARTSAVASSRPSMPSLAGPPISPTSPSQASAPSGPIQAPREGPGPAFSAMKTTRTEEPYFVQIGFDFGTSFSKCVCRDVVTDRAWVHIPERSAHLELPFLIPTVLTFGDGRVRRAGREAGFYPEDGLFHMKIALEKAALEAWNDQVFEPFCRLFGTGDPGRLREVVEATNVFFLAGALGEVRREVKRRLKGFGSHPRDHMAVNMAIPIADAEQPRVYELFSDILRTAWMLSDPLAGCSEIRLAELLGLVAEKRRPSGEEAANSCFIYPEVSANVQGFVRSRVSSPGIYLLSDTGAGWVDQSVFIFLRRDDGELLSYLDASVLALGSSQIEFRAASREGRMDVSSLEQWRERKERSNNEPQHEHVLAFARNAVAAELAQGTRTTLAKAKRKLCCKDQLQDTRVIFSGGGHCPNPYGSAVVEQFSCDLFLRPFKPEVVGLPTPRDLEILPDQARWMSRLSVAYGLSFVKEDLARFKYPKELDEPSEIWMPQAREIHAPSKEEC